MPERSKRYYLCNLIPLGEIDEKEMDVDWPVYHAYNGELIEIRTDIKKRQIRWSDDSGANVDTDLKIRFEVYESDYLLSGWRNDWKGTFSSHPDYGDDIALRPIKIVDDVDKIPENEKEESIFIHWINAHETTVTIIAPDGTSTEKTEKIPDTLQIRCWWRIPVDSEIDVSGNPEYYYDVYVDGKLKNDDDIQLHERSDHELETFSWNVTKDKRKGRMQPLVDGEYAFIKMAQILDSAEETIHILNWKMDPQTPLIIDHEYKGDYTQIHNLDEYKFKNLIRSNKPLTLGVSVKEGIVYYTVSNGNVVGAAIKYHEDKIKSSFLNPCNIVQQIDDPTNLDLPSDIHVLNDNTFLVLDQLRSRLLLFMVRRKEDRIVEIEPNKNSGIYLFRLLTKTFIFRQIRPGFFNTVGNIYKLTERSILYLKSESIPDELLSRLEPVKNVEFSNKNDFLNEVKLKIGDEKKFNLYKSFILKYTISSNIVAGFVMIAGDGNPGYKNGGITDLDKNKQSSGIYRPVSKMNHPTGMVVVEQSIFITDTGNHCIRKIDSFNTTNIGTIGTSLEMETLALGTLSGAPSRQGLIDGAATVASFDSPTGIAWNSISDKLLVADRGNHKIRSVDPTTGETKTLIISAFNVSSGTFGEMAGLAFDPRFGKGTLYIAEYDKHRILSLDLNNLKVDILAGSPKGEFGFKDGSCADALFNNPLGIVFDGKAAILVADSNNHVIRVIDLNHKIVTTLGSPQDIGDQDIPVTLADLLRRKAAEGIKIRILLDYQGSEIKRDTGFISISGEQIRSDLSFIHQDINTFIHQLGYTGSYHEKMIVVDGKYGVLGGIDFDDDKNDSIMHDRNHRVSIRWHDVSAFIEGKVAIGLEEVFVNRWKMARDERIDEDIKPDILYVKEFTDSSIEDCEAEIVQTFDPTPVLGILPNIKNDAILDILESYKRAILSARYYIYLEHQYIYFPKIAEFLEKALNENQNLQVILLIPFYTEESVDPTKEKAELEIKDKLITSMSEILKRDFFVQIKKQGAWHGLFRQYEMIKKLRELAPNRFGVFSIQRIVERPYSTTLNNPPESMSEMIYPHSKMILCDDKFLSIGSANANGRGFMKDGEINISSIAPIIAKKLRIRLWGEHLGFFGVAIVIDEFTLFLVNGHHLKSGASICLYHPLIKNIEHQVVQVNSNNGFITFKGEPIPNGLKRLLWEDPTFADMPLNSALNCWRNFSHPLKVYKKVIGKARTDLNGDIILNGHLAMKGDYIRFDTDHLIQRDENQESGKFTSHKLLKGYLVVKDTKANIIKLKAPENKWKINIQEDTNHSSLEEGDTYNIDPFVCKMIRRYTKNYTKYLEFEPLGLMPGLTELPFDYLMSWLKRQSGGKKYVRAWEIDSPEGIEYDGPFSKFFSFWNPIYPLLWLFVDADIDELANLDFDKMQVSEA